MLFSVFNTVALEGRQEPVEMIELTTIKNNTVQMELGQGWFFNIIELEVIAVCYYSTNCVGIYFPNVRAINIGI